jgi:two-component system OmpR family sensor kinase/two-component system sensor histidine kinase BaeS
VFALVLVLSAIGALNLVSVVLGAPLGAAPGQLPPVAVAALAGLFLSMILMLAVRRVGSTLNAIVDASSRVADGDYSTRIAEHGPPPVRTVASAFNTMATRLQALDTQRRELMADVAHELRTPLTVIQGRLEGLLDGVYPRDDARLAQVLEETRLMARLVEDLRTLAHAENGALGLRKEPTDMAMLIRDAVASVAPAADSRQFTVDLPEDLPALDLDPLRIRQVLVNLLSNALHHTPAAGAVTVTARVSSGEIAVSVADAGPGMPAEEVVRVFDRFYKGAASAGSGLGLAIARNLVLAHGGAIRAESRAGAGTTVTFTLPR